MVIESTDQWAKKAERVDLNLGSPYAISNIARRDGSSLDVVREMDGRFMSAGGQVKQNKFRDLTIDAGFVKLQAFN